MANSIIINELLKKLRYSVHEFEQAIGVGKSRIGASIKREADISTDTIEKIVAKFPNVNRAWLETGDGPMFKDEAKAVPFGEFMEAPYLPATAQAGYAKGFEDYSHPEAAETMLVPREFEKGNYLVIEVSGDSMDDGTSRSICDGDKLLLKELSRDNWVFKLQFKRHLFVIVTREGVICKQIIDHDLEHKTITCHSYNPTLKDFTISLEHDVRQLFYVKKIVEKKLQHIIAPLDEKTEHIAAGKQEPKIHSNKADQTIMDTPDRLMHMLQQALDQRDKDLENAAKLIDTIKIMATKIPDVKADRSKKSQPTS